MFGRLRNSCLKLKHSKCDLFSKDVKHLGKKVSVRGIEPDSAKVEHILNWHPPTNVKDF